MPVLKPTLGLALAVSLSACALHAEAPPHLFDLGPLPVQASASPVANPWHVQVVAAEDLDNTAMRYRLLYADPDGVLAYRDSRWSTSPVQLLQRRLATLLSAPEGGDVRVELLAFEQAFTAPERAQVRVRARVSWGQGDQMRAADLDVNVDAAPNAAGFAAAAAPACDRLVALLSAQMVQMQTVPTVPAAAGR